MIYFDNAATSPLDREVLDSYYKFLEDNFANSSSLHQAGSKMSNYLEKAREAVASFLGVKSKEVIFTSGASESNNTILKGMALKYRNRGNKIITTHLEHPSVRETLKQLVKYEGVEVSYVDVDSDGTVDLKQLESLIDDKTILVSMTAVASETGHMLNIDEVGNLLKKYPKVYFHVDATQKVGKYPIDTKNIDLLSFSSHKFFGLKGSGILMKKENIELEPLIAGGEQEFGIRAGTVDVAAALMCAKALRLAYENMDSRLSKVKEIHDYAFNKLKEVKEVVVNSSPLGSAFIINFSLPNYNAEVVLNEFSSKGIYLSSKSACSSQLAELSETVDYLYKDQKRAKTSLRISFSYLNSKEEVDIFLNELENILRKVKKVS